LITTFKGFFFCFIFIFTFITNISINLYYFWSTTIFCFIVFIPNTFAEDCCRPEVIEVDRYICDKCKDEYETEKEAFECCNQTELNLPEITALTEGGGKDEEKI